MAVINVLLVEDHPMMRNALKIALEDQLQIGVMHEAQSLAEARQIAVDFAPDLVLLDIYLPDGSGIDFIDFRNLHLPDARIVVLTSSDDEEDMMAAFRAGADGFLVKDASPEQLMLAIRAALAGNRMLTPGATSILLKNLVSETGKPGAGRRELTKREKSILQLLARGHTSAMIAEALHITESTLRSHYQNIYKKTSIANHNQLLVYAAKHFSQT